MTEISHNPSGCCATCDDFDECLSCDGSPMTLEITLSGAPSPDLLCGCPSDNFQYHRRQLLWDNLNATFKLPQIVLSGNQFEVNCLGGCEAAMDCDEAVLIEDEFMGCCIGTEGDFAVESQRKVYVGTIYVQLACVENRMQIHHLIFSFCQCERHLIGSVWSDWSCEILTQYPAYAIPFPCRLGDQIRTAVPCSNQQMACELLWNDPTTLTDPCLFDFPCEEPIVGQITARLGCN